MYAYNLISVEMSNIVNNDNYFQNKLRFSRNYSFDLFESMIITQLCYAYIYLQPYFNEYGKFLIKSIEYSNYYSIHPEVATALANNPYFCKIFYSEPVMSFISFSTRESTVNFWFTVIDVSLWVLFISFFLMFFFAFYTNATTSENLIDHDYLVTTVTVESEEEVAAYDDSFLCYVLVVILFFWFFWANGYAQWFWSNSYQMIFSVFPFLYILIFMMPLLLLIDYGIYFLTYLSGSGKSTSVFTELGFDYIAVSIFFLRLLVQNVRLIFMVFTFTELHEILLLNHVYIKYSWFDDCIVANKGNYWNIFKNGHYYLFMLCGAIANEIYELLHTFFMLIFQFIAFFAMIFWLFLFLYTMFTVEMHEAHFYLKRKYLKIKKNLKRFFRIY